MPKFHNVNFLSFRCQTIICYIWLTSILVFGREMILDILKKDDENQLENYMQQNPDVDAVIRPYQNNKEPYLLHQPSLISAAAFFGSINCFTFLQHRDASLECVDEDGLTLAHFASLGGNNDICDLLDSSSIPFDAIDKHGCTCLHYACLSENFSLVQKLFLRGLEIDAPNNEGLKPIHFAAQGPSVEILEFLVSEGADFNEKIGSNTPLFLSIINNRPENAKFLIEKGATVSPKSPDGKILLIECATKGQNEMVSILIEKCHFNPNEQDELGWTALLHATDQNNIDVCHTLIDHGADVNIASIFGFTPIHCAMNRKFNELIDYFTSIGGKIYKKPITSDTLQTILKSIKK